MFGVKPKDQLLQKYDLTRQFGILISSVFSGNVSSFRKAILDNQEFYIKKELYLIIQLKLKNYLYLKLVRLFAGIYVKIN